MSKASAARRLATAAAFGGGGLGVLSGSLYGLLMAEAKIARHRIGDAESDPLDPSGLYGAMLPPPAIRLSVLGDSASAGYGVTTPQETTGAYIAAGLSRLAGRPVRMRSVGMVGAQSSDLVDQIPLALQINPDVCVIIVGANDVTHRVRPSAAVRALQDTVETLRAGRSVALRSDGPAVVVGTCPDLGTVRPISPPLRQVARRWSRRLAAAQTIAAVEAGARSVSLGSILGPEFEARPADMFGPDRFHPSSLGYKSCATAMLPSIAAAVGVLPDERAEPEVHRGEGVFLLHDAAVTAADSSGTEVSQGEHKGSRHGPRGRWALLRRRRRHAIGEVGEVEPDSETGEADEAEPGSETGDAPNVGAESGVPPEGSPTPARK
ncbi:MAG: SGNH/GDSL hydrolase family protein [Nocardioidaceae bacterium]